MHSLDDVCFSILNIDDIDTSNFPDAFPEFTLPKPPVYEGVESTAEAVSLFPTQSTAEVLSLLSTQSRPTAEAVSLLSTQSRPTAEAVSLFSTQNVPTGDNVLQFTSSETNWPLITALVVPFVVIVVVSAIGFLIYTKKKQSDTRRVSMRNEEAEKGEEEIELKNAEPDYPLSTPPIEMVAPIFPKDEGLVNPTMLEDIEECPSDSDALSSSLSLSPKAYSADIPPPPSHPPPPIPSPSLLPLVHKENELHLIDMETLSDEVLIKPGSDQTAEEMVGNQSGHNVISAQVMEAKLAQSEDGSENEDNHSIKE